MAYFNQFPPGTQLGTFSEPRGTFAERPGTFAEPKGTFAERPGTFAEPKGTFAEPRGTFAERPGTFAEPKGTFAEPKGTFSERPGTFSEARGTFSERPGTFSEGLRSGNNDAPADVSYSFQPASPIMGAPAPRKNPLQLGMPELPAMAKPLRLSNDLTAGTESSVMRDRSRNSNII